MSINSSLSSSPVHTISNCKIDIVLPRNNFKVGDTIPFEVKFENPRRIAISSMSVRLVQNTFYSRHPGKRNSCPELKFKSARISSYRDPVHPACDDNLCAQKINWVGSVQVPKELPLVRKSFRQKDRRLEEIRDIQYILQVDLSKGGTLYDVISEIFPIQINGLSLPRKGRDLAKSPQSSNPPPILLVESEPKSSENYRSENSRGGSGSSSPSRSGSRQSMLGVELGSHCNCNGNGKDSDWPPTYSMLSLPGCSFVSSRCSSMETLPPHYQEM